MKIKNKVKEEQVKTGNSQRYDRLQMKGKRIQKIFNLLRWIIAKEISWY